MNEFRLRQEIRKRIDALPDGANLPSGRALAAECGLSPSTVNRVLARLQGEGLLHRQGYKCRVHKKKPENQKLWNVLLFGSNPEPFEETSRFLQSRGTRVHIEIHTETGPQRKALLACMKEPPDGLILEINPDNLDLVPRLEQAGIHVVCCGKQPAGHRNVILDHEGTVERAVQYLAELGHREIAFVARDFDRVDAQKMKSIYEQTCRRLQLTSSLERVLLLRTSVKIASRIRPWFQKPGAPPTAMICWDLEQATALRKALRRSGYKIPEQVSLLILVNHPQAYNFEPPLTTVAVDPGEAYRLAAHLLLEDMAYRKQHAGERFQQIRCEATLTIRESSIPPVAPKPAKRAAGQSLSQWSDDEPGRRKQVESFRKKSLFPHLPSSLCSYDLSPYVNRAFGPHSSWLGGFPLRYFQPGSHRFCGVPFEIRTGDNHRHAAVVLRSRRSKSSRGELLPTQIDLPLDRKVKGLYFLHTAGWIRNQDPFAEYVFEYTRGKAERLPVCGFDPDNEASEEAQLPCLQDWHPSHPVYRDARTRPVLITGDGDPFVYERYLYVHHWVNPRPELTLKTLQLRTLFPEQAPTLALLALTLDPVT